MRIFITGIIGFALLGIIIVNVPYKGHIYIYIYNIIFIYINNKSTETVINRVTTT